MKKNLFLLLITALLASCGGESEETDKLNQAQACIDNATQATAAGCLTALDGLTSEESYAIRCAGDFLIAGITTTVVAEAIEAGEDDTGADADPLLGLLGILIVTDSDLSDQIDADCNASGSAGLVTVASYVKMASALAVLDSDLLDAVTNGDLTDANTQALVETAVDNILIDIDNGDADAEDIGEAAVTLQSSVCSGESQPEVCTDVNNAIADGNGDTSEIGKAILEYLAESE